MSHTLISAGPASIESEFHEALSVPGTIRKTPDVQRRGADAVIIDCMGGPGVRACREVVSIPMPGPCQTSLHVAALLGHRFAFLTELDRLRSVIGKLMATYGLQEQYPAFRAVDMPVLEIGADPDRLQDALAHESRRPSVTITRTSLNPLRAHPSCASLRLPSAVARRRRCI